MPYFTDLGGPTPKSVRDFMSEEVKAITKTENENVNIKSPNKLSDEARELVKRLRSIHPEEYVTLTDFVYGAQQAMSEAAGFIEGLMEESDRDHEHWKNAYIAMHDLWIDEVSKHQDCPYCNGHKEGGQDDV